MRRAILAGLLVLAAGCKKGSSITEPECRITGVTVSQAQVTMTVGQTVDVQAAIAQSGCTGLPSLTFSSSDQTIVTVTPSGTVTAVAVGTATVTAQIQGRNEKASAQVTVVGRVLSLTLAPDSTAIPVTGTVQLAATLSVDPGTATGLEWTSSDPAKASVSGTGLVTGVAAGTVVVTVKSLADPTKTATAKVTVIPRVTGVVVDPVRDTILVVETLPINATVSGDPGVATTVTWRSSNPAVATVAAAPGGGAPAAGAALVAGVVTGVAAGTAEITAVSTADTTRRATATIVVLPRVFGITVTPPAATVAVTGTQALTASVTGDPGVSVEVTWTSSDLTKATVSATGVVTGVAVGSAVITARSVADPTRTATSAITVVPRVTGVTVTPANSSIAVAGTVPLTATVTGDPGVTTTVTWNSLQPAIATVSATGVVTGVATGTATIVATSTADPSKSGSAQVSVGTPTGDVCFQIVDPGGSGESPPALPPALLATPACPVEVRLDLLFDGFPLAVQGYLASTGAMPTMTLTNSNPGVVVATQVDPALWEVFAGGFGNATLEASLVSAPATKARILARVVNSPETVCMALTPSGPCATSVSVRVGQSVTVYSRNASGQPAAAVWNGLGLAAALPEAGFFDTKLTITGVTVGSMGLFYYWTGQLVPTPSLATINVIP